MIYHQDFNTPTRRNAGVYLTQRQMECLRHIANGVTKQRDIAKAMLIKSVTGANDHIRALAAKGMIVLDDAKRSGAITVTDTGWRRVGLCSHLASANRTYAALKLLGEEFGTPVKFCPWCARRIPPEVR